MAAAGRFQHNLDVLYQHPWLMSGHGCSLSKLEKVHAHVVRVSSGEQRRSLAQFGALNLEPDIGLEQSMRALREPANGNRLNQVEMQSLNEARSSMAHHESRVSRPSR